MIDINTDIFIMSEKRFVLKAFSEEYSSQIDIGFDDLEELEATTIGLSLKLNTLEKDGEIIALQNAYHLKTLVTTLTH